MKKNYLLVLVSLAAFALAGCGANEGTEVTRIQQESLAGESVMQAEAPKTEEVMVVEDNFEYIKEAKSEDTSSAETSQISRDEAVKIVLAKVSGATEQNLEMELEKDDGYWKYDGEIKYNGREYEFELSAETGKILEWSNEPIDD